MCSKLGYKDLSTKIAYVICHRHTAYVYINLCALIYDSVGNSYDNVCAQALISAILDMRAVWNYAGIILKLCAEISLKFC